MTSKTIESVRLIQSAGFQPEQIIPLIQRDDYLVAKVTTADGRILQLKASTTPEHCHWDAFHARLLRSADVPTQTVLADGEDPVSYVLLEWIEGEPLSSAHPLAIQQEAGRWLKRIHHMTDRPPYKRDYSYAEWMEGWLNAVLGWWKEQDGVTTAMIDNVWTHFRPLQPLFETRGTHYMLLDGRPDHFLVRDNQLVGLIDVHAAQAGDGAMDIAVLGLFDDVLLHNVQIGYDASAEEREAHARLIPYYRFIRRINAAEWHSQHGDPNIVEHALMMAMAEQL